MNTVPATLPAGEISIMTMTVSVGKCVVSGVLYDLIDENVNP